MKKFFLSLLAGSIYLFTNAQQPLWKADMGNMLKKIDWMQQSDYGYLICGTNDAQIIGINNTDGKQLWANKDLPLGANASGSKFIEGTPYMLVEYQSLTGKGRAMLLNILDGKTIYNSTEDGVKVAETHKLLAAGGILLETIKEKEQIVSWIDTKTATVKWSISIGHEKGGLGGMLRSLTSQSFLGGEPFIGTDGSVVLSFKHDLLSLNHETGATNWKAEMPKDIESYVASADGKLIFIGAEKKFDIVNALDGKSYLKKPIKLSGDFNRIMPYKENYFIMHANGFNIWDVNKMDFVWDKEKEVGNISQIIVCPNGFAALENKEKEAKISFLDFNGKRIWDESLDKPVVNMYSTSKGIWYTTTERANVLSFEKGKDYWKRDVKLKGLPSMALDQANNSVAIYANKMLYKFDLAETNMTVLNEEAKLKDYDEDKQFANLEIRKDGYLVSTPQNLCFIDRSGAVKFNNFYKEVGMSKGMKFGMKLLGTAAATYGAANSVGDYLNNPGKFKSENGVVNLDDDYNRSQLSFKSQAGNEAGSTLFDVANQRHNASKATKDFVYILTKFDDGTKGLVKVGKDDGKEVKRFLFRDNSPEYVVDEVEGKLYLIESDKEVLCFDTK